MIRLGNSLSTMRFRKYGLFCFNLGHFLIDCKSSYHSQATLCKTENYGNIFQFYDPKLDHLNPQTSR